MKRALALALLLAGASPVHGFEAHLLKEPLRIDITESFWGAYHGDLGALVSETDASGRPVLGAHFFDILSRLNADLAWGSWRLAARFDTAVFFDTPAGACGPDATTPTTLRSRFCQRYFYLEKLAIEYHSRSFDATLGDFYVNFGRGIVLSIRKVDELGIDTTLRGGKYVYHEDNVTATVVAGISNIQNVDEATGRIIADPDADTGLGYPAPHDVIAGGRFEYRIANKVILGLHTTGGTQARNASTAPQARPDGMLMYGGSLDAPRIASWLALYAEADGQRVTSADQRSDGYALYGSATGYFGPVSVLLEVKHYSNFKRWRSSVDPAYPEFAPVVYNQPPTAERVVTELTAPIYDVSGPRLRVDWRVNDWLLLYASTAYFQDRAGVGGAVDYHDPYGGAELRWNGGASHFFPSGGYRIEECESSNMVCQEESPGGEFQHVGHVEWDFTQALPRGMSIESQGFIYFRHGDLAGVTNPDGSTSYPDWTEGDAYVAFKWTPHLIFSLGYEWSTRPSTSATQNYFNGAVQWNITPATYLRLFAGGMRGGLKCISGICRDFPAFTGASLEAVIRL